MTGPLPMKVAYLVNQYPHVSHSFIRREIRALEQLGHSVSRFSVRASGADLADPADRAEQARTAVLLSTGPAALAPAVIRALLSGPGAFFRAAALAVRMGRRSDRGLLRHFVYLAEACRLREELERAGAEHLHAHFGTNPAAVAAMCRELGGPSFSFTVHGPEEFDKPEALSLSDKIARAAFVVGVSSFGRSQLYRWTPLEQWPKAQVVRCGVDDQFLDPRAEPAPAPREPALVCVGRLCEQKGQALLVDAAHRLAREGRDFTITLVGDGPMRPQLERAIRDRALQKHVRITGYVSGAEVRAHIERSRALVLPSFAEGLPVVIMEALALGRPVVSTYVAGIPELVEPGVCGWLTPAGDIDALMEALRAVLDVDPRHLAALGRAGRERVLERHDASREAARLAELFRAAIGREPSTAESCERPPGRAPKNEPHPLEPART